MPLINDFRSITGAIDFTRWRNDIILRLLDDMGNAQEGLTTRGLSQTYFENDDLETVILVGQQMQAVREMLQNRNTPLLLLNSHFRWYVVPPGDTARARQFLVNRTRRMLNAYVRLGQYVEIGRMTYELSEVDRLVIAVEGAGEAMGQLGEAIDPDEEEEG